MGLSQIGGTTYSRLVTKQNTSGETYFSASILTPGSGSYGSWVQFTASTGVEYAITGIYVVTAITGMSTTFLPLILQVGTGGSGAESALGTRTVPLENMATSTGVPSGLIPLSVPWRVSAGTRLAVRANAQNSTGNTAWTVDLSVIPWASLEGN